MGAEVSRAEGTAVKDVKAVKKLHMQDMHQKNVDCELQKWLLAI